MLSRLTLSLSILALFAAAARGENLRGDRELRSIFRDKSFVTVSPSCPGNPLNLAVTLEGSLSDNTVVSVRFACDSGRTTYEQDLCSQDDCEDLLNTETNVVITNFLPPTGTCTLELLHSFTATRRGRETIRTYKLSSTNFEVPDENDSLCATAKAVTPPKGLLEGDLVDKCYGDTIGLSATFQDVDDASKVTVEFGCRGDGITIVPIQETSIIETSGEQVTFPLSDNTFDETQEADCFVKLIVTDDTGTETSIATNAFKIFPTTDLRCANARAADVTGTTLSPSTTTTMSTSTSMFQSDSDSEFESEVESELESESQGSMSGSMSGSASDSGSMSGSNSRK